MYVVADPDLVQKVQKQHEVIAFTPIITKFAARTANVSDHSLRAIEEDNFALTHASNDVLVQGLKPGENLDNMNRIMLTQLNESMQKLQPRSGGMKTIKFNEWLKESLASATTRSLYGPKNPYDDPEIVDAFW